MSDEPVAGKAAGGKARVNSMTAEERSQMAKKGAATRWDKSRKMNSMPSSSHRGEITIGNHVIPCFVLEDGRRVVSEIGLTTIFGTSGGKTYRLREQTAPEAGGPLPLFLASKALHPFIHAVFEGMDLAPVEFVDDGKVWVGYDAKTLPKVCEVWLQADEAKALQRSQAGKAKTAGLLMRGLAHVGIIALVDEATGYQYERPRRDLEEQLKRYLSDSLRKWVQTFPADYFKHLCRLRGVDLRPDMRLPQYFGTLTNNIVYRRIAPGLLARLKEHRQANGAGRSKLHSWLSADYGFQEVLLHLGTVITVMKQNTDYATFEHELEKVAPIYPDVPGLFDDPKDWEKTV